MGNSSRYLPSPSTYHPGPTKVHQVFNSIDQALNGKLQPHKLDMHSIRMSGLEEAIGGIILTCEVTQDFSDVS